MENTRKNVFEFRMAPCGETRSRTRRRRGRDRSHNSLWVSMFHFAVCLSSLNSCCGFCLSFSFSLCFPFLRYPGLQASPAMFPLPFVFFSVCVSGLVFPRRFLLLFFVFGCPWGGDGEPFFQLWGAFSAEAGTFDFDRQYSTVF